MCSQELLDVGAKVFEKFDLALGEEDSVLVVGFSAGLLGGVEGLEDGLGVEGTGV